MQNLPTVILSQSPSRLLEVARGLAHWLEPYVDEARVSAAPQLQKADIEGRTVAVVTPVASDKAPLRGGLVQASYQYEVGILRWLLEDESEYLEIDRCEAIATALLSQTSFDFDAECSGVETTVIDVDATKRRKEFVCVLTVTFQDCLMLSPAEDGIA